MKTFTCLITGPAGAGKTTVTNLLAKELGRSVVIEVDVLKKMVKSGYVKEWPYNNEVALQTALGVKNACDMAKNFMNEGFNVFIDDVVGITDLNGYYKHLDELPFKTFLLLPNKEVNKERDANREDKTIGDRVLELNDAFAKKADKGNWHIIDSSNQTAEQTKDEIFSLLEEAI